MTDKDNTSPQFVLGGEKTEKVKRTPADKAEVPYRKLYQGNATNSLANAYIRKEAPDIQELDLFDNDGKQGFKYNLPINSNLSISFLNCVDVINKNGVEERITKPLELSVGAQKLLKAGSIIFTEQIDHQKARDGNIPIKDLEVVIPLTQYAQLLGRGDTKADIDHIRTKVYKELDELYNISIHYEKRTAQQDTNKKSKRKDVGANDFIDSRVITKKEITNGNICFTFAPDYGKYLGKSYIMNYPIDLLKISTQQSPLAYFIGNILAIQNNIGAKDKKPDEHKTIGVRTIIEKAIETGLLPNLEEQRKKGELKRRYIDPIEKALDVLLDNGIITDWGYSKGKNERLTMSGTKLATFDELLNAYIFFIMPPQEQQTEQRG